MSEYTITNTQFNGKTVYHVKYRGKFVIKNARTEEEAKVLIEDHKKFITRAENWHKW